MAIGAKADAQGSPTEDRAIKVRKLLENAHSQIGTTVLYDPAYVDLKYPGGDVPADRGVCSDVIIRAFRGAGIDLQNAKVKSQNSEGRSQKSEWESERQKNLGCEYGM